MGRPPCCEETGVKKGPWTPEEDEKLMAYISKHGSGNWRTLPKHAGLKRCGKSCRLRWTNYLRPDIKRGKFTEEEEKMIINLHSVLGNKWSKIATHLSGRTDNEIKNFWNINLRKKLLQMGIDPETHKPRTDFNHVLNLSQLLGMSNNTNNLMNPAWGHGGLVGLLQQPNLSHQLAQIQLLQNLLQLMNANSSSFVNNMQNSLPLLGNQNLMNINPPIEAANINGTLPNNLKNQELYASPTALLPSMATSDQSGHDISESRTDLEEGASDQQQCLGVNNSLSRTSSHEFNEAYENPFAAISSNAEGVPPTVFDPWEKLLEDDYASDSYWKELFDLTSTSTSPISW